MKPSIPLTILNTQQISRPHMDKDGILQVHKIWRTIQGEGPFAGRPAVFVRLAGCNLQCPACDTDYTSSPKKMSTNHILQQVNELLVGTVGTRLVVLTGGEPFIQNIIPLIGVLNGAGYNVQVETNGTYFDDLHNNIIDNSMLTIVCSPKTPIINRQFRMYVDALKYVVDAETIDPTDGLPTHTLGNECRVARPWIGFCGQIYVQPLDVQDEVRNKENMRVAVESCQRFGYTLCLQLHKIIGVE